MTMPHTTVCDEDPQAHRPNKKSISLKGTIWTKQVKGSLTWIQAFLSSSMGPLSRTWDLRYYWASSRLHFVLDASPYGVGGVLYEDGVPIETFFDQLTEHDERIHQHKIRDSSG